MRPCSDRCTIQRRNTTHSRHAKKDHVANGCGCDETRLRSAFRRECSLQRTRRGFYRGSALGRDGPVRYETASQESIRARHAARTLFANIARTIKDGSSTAIQHAEPLAINVSEPGSRWVIRGAPRAIAESKRAMCKNICRQKAPCGNAQTRLWYQNEIVSKRTVYRLGKQGLRLRFPSVIHVLSLR